MMNVKTVFICLLAVLNSQIAVARGGDQTIAPALHTEPWTNLPPTHWPQLVLTNEASFRGHTSLEGASAFLMRMPNGEVLLGTAKHLIKEPGGVDPPINLLDLDRVLTRWKVFPRTKEALAVEAKGVAESRNHEHTHDWLLLHLVDPRAKLPSIPLVPRPEPAKVGETVYLVGVPYSDRRSAQNVYKGIVTGRPGEHYFTYEFSPPVKINGFSGAPIVDTNGLLLGHGVSRSASLKQQNGLEIEFGGEDASLALELWQQRNDPPPVRPADVLHIQWPAGWVQKSARSPKILAMAEYPPLGAVAELVAEPKSEFDASVDLASWAALVKHNTAAAKSSLTQRQETNLVHGKIGGRPTIEYEITGELRRTPLRQRIVMLEVNGCYCKVVCVVAQRHWEQSQPKFEEVVQALR